MTASHLDLLVFCDESINVHHPPLVAFENVVELHVEARMLVSVGVTLRHQVLLLIQHLLQISLQLDHLAAEMATLGYHHGSKDLLNTPFPFLGGRGGVWLGELTIAVNPFWA